MLILYKRFQDKINQKRKRMSLCISKGKIHQEDGIIVKLYALSVGEHNLINTTGHKGTDA
jgi:hypothetical protein